MRASTYFEAYLDDFDRVVVFMSKSSYDGVSNQFHLRDPQGAMQELTIQSIEQVPANYNKYTLKINHEIEIGKEYYVVHQHARETIMEYSAVVKSERFDEMFYYAGNDLGTCYTKDQTQFALWAPTASRIKLEVSKNGILKTYEMIRSERGVFRFTIFDNVENATYIYMIRVNGEWKESVDPYAFATTSNSKRSVILDYEKIKVQPSGLKPMKSACDAIIYETSVRDFTMQRGIGVEHQGTYLGFVEENDTTIVKQTGFSYLKSLGITHVQLMPVLDFGSVDENFPHVFYNWGYDPMHWMCLEGSLASDVENPYERIFEFTKLVEKCHENNIRVNLDVVFNHVYDMPKSAINTIVPYYYFQMNGNGDFSNGTYCGNDIDSTRKMCSKLIVDSCKFLCETYRIDGLRFDLMGILDIDTMNKVVSVCKAINSDFMIYGEGWDMPSFLDSSRRASIGNNAQMPSVAHFSDRFRDIAKGNTSPSEVNVKGYCTGAVYLIDLMENVLIGSCADYGYNRIFQNPCNVVNYVECHDNMTCWDKLKECCKEDSREIRILKHEMLLAAVLLAQGIPFIHSGQEFARSKYGKHNTYSDSDEINKLDYDRKKYNEEMVTCTKALIEIRKKYQCLRYGNAKDVQEHVDFYDIERKVIVYHIHDEREELMVFFNPTAEFFTYHLEKEYEIIYYNKKVNHDKVEDVNINPYSTVVLSVSNFMV